MMNPSSFQIKDVCLIWISLFECLDHVHWLNITQLNRWVIRKGSADVLKIISSTPDVLIKKSPSLITSRLETGSLEQKHYFYINLTFGINPTKLWKTCLYFKLVVTYKVGKLYTTVGSNCPLITALYASYASQTNLRSKVKKHA